MRKFLFLLGFFASVVVYAQTAVEKRLASAVQKIHSAKTVSELETLFQSCSELTTQLDKNNHWQGYYYAGLAAYKQAIITKKQNKNTDVSTFLSLAYKYANSALYNKQNAETYALIGHIEYEMIKNNKSDIVKNIHKSVQRNLEQAETLDRDNLRVLLLKSKLMVDAPSSSQEQKKQLKSKLSSVVKENSPVKYKNMPMWGKEESQEILSKL